MAPVTPLPLPASELPAAIRKFGDPAAPGPARTMAAKGLVPVKGEDLVALLLQLSADEQASIADAAKKTLTDLPDGVLLAACEAALHPSMLDRLADVVGARDEALERIVENQATSDSTIQRLARRGSEYLTEVIATNQQRLLGAPRIIEALYHNQATRMSTADRLIELAARNGVELPGIPAFAAHVEAIQGQLIPEASDEPLPSDLDFQHALAEDEDDDAIERDDADGSESLKRKFEPLYQRVGKMSISERIRLAQVGNASARAILVRDPNKLVSHAAISSPRANEAEAARYAKSKEMPEEILRYIGNKRDWVRNYEVKRALVQNPKTPVGVALKFLGHLRHNDLRSVSRSRNVAAPIKAAAQQKIAQKQKGGGRR